MHLRTQKTIAINLFAPHKHVIFSEETLNKALKTTDFFREKFKLPQPGLIPPYEENFDQ